jgi:hypothetical protein
MLNIQRMRDGTCRLPVSNLAVQERYNMGVFSSVLTGSLQGIADRPLPCNYNVIQFVSALSRRRRGFKSRRGHAAINALTHEQVAQISQAGKS